MFYTAFEMIALVREFTLREDGATLVEYGIVAALVSLGCIIALEGIGTSVNTSFTNTINDLFSFETGPPP